MITKVTITGADDSIDPKDLVELKAGYPFVEWGILVSKSQMGGNRFPSYEWIERLAMTDNLGDLSCHLCGRWVRAFVQGNKEVVDHLSPAIWNIFKRVQLNFHAIPHLFTPLLSKVITENPDKEFIFQYDGVNDSTVRSIVEGCSNVSVLFDKSGGAGILPRQWPEHLRTIKCGYAGGLSPNNVIDEIPKIIKAAGEHEIWIDVETHVRTNMDTQFDLILVERFLRNCQSFIP